MKNSLYIFLLLINFYINAKEWSFKYSGFVNLKTINLPSGGRIINMTNKGTWEDSLGNYGNGVCYGIVESKINKDDFIKYYCELSDQDNEKFFTKGGRKSDDVEAGVGTQEIIEGTGKWQSLVGSVCTYGVKYKDEVVFASQKCKLKK